MDPETNPARTGGMWSDSNVAEDISWIGTDIPSMPAAVPVLRSPEPAAQAEVVAAQAAEISTEAIKRIKESVVRDIALQLGGKGDSMRAAIQSLLIPHEKKLKEWVETRSTANSQLESIDHKYEELSGRLDLMSQQIAELGNTLTQRGETENRVLEQAMKIIQDRPAASSEADNPTEAQLAELAKRRDEINLHVEQIRTAVPAARKPDVAPTRTRRRGQIY